MSIISKILPKNWTNRFLFFIWSGSARWQALIRWMERPPFSSTSSPWTTRASKSWMSCKLVTMISATGAIDNQQHYQKILCRTPFGSYSYSFFFVVDIFTMCNYYFHVLFFCFWTYYMFNYYYISTSKFAIAFFRCFCFHQPHSICIVVVMIIVWDLIALLENTKPLINTCTMYIRYSKSLNICSFMFFKGDIYNFLQFQYFLLNWKTSSMRL